MSIDVCVSRAPVTQMPHTLTYHAPCPQTHRAQFSHARRIGPLATNWSCNGSNWQRKATRCGTCDRRGKMSIADACNVHFGSASDCKRARAAQLYRRGTIDRPRAAIVFLVFWYGTAPGALADATAAHFHRAVKLGSCAPCLQTTPARFAPCFGHSKLTLDKFRQV